MRISQLTQAGFMPADFVYTDQKQTFEGRFMPGSARRARIIQNELLDKGMQCNFEKNGYLAKCVKRMTEIYEELFGRWALPQIVDFQEFMGFFLQNASGYFSASEDKVAFNRSKYEFVNRLFQSIRAKTYRGKEFNLFSSSHSAQVYAHEFGHSAHFHNISQKHNPAFAINMMKVLREKTLHEPVGILITKFKLGEYSLTNMNEFMAERITQDICDNLRGSDWEIWPRNPDVGYSDIFSRKWHDKFDTPQAYLDYYTEQVWDGDLKNADEAAEKIRKFLELLDQNVPVEQAIRIRDNLIPLEVKKEQLTEKICLMAAERLKYAETLAEVEKILVKHPNRQSALKRAINLTNILTQKVDAMRTLENQKLSVLNSIMKKSEVPFLQDEVKEQIQAQKDMNNTVSTMSETYTTLNTNYEKRLNEAVRIQKEQEEKARLRAAEKKAREAMSSSYYSYAPVYSSYNNNQVQAETTKTNETVSQAYKETQTSAQTEPVISSPTYSSAQNTERKSESLFGLLGRKLKSVIELFSEGSISKTEYERRERERMKLLQ